MADVIVHGIPPSSYTRTVRMVCTEKGLTHELVIPNLGDDAYLRMHPYRKVPVIDHGGVRIYETTAIIRYLDEVGTGPSLLPATARDRATMESWLSVLNCYVYPAVIRDIVLGYIFPKGPDGKPDTAAIEAAVPRARSDLKLLDEQLAGRDFIAGPAISLADLAFAPVVASLTQTPVKDAVLGDAPNVLRWLGAISRRDSFVQAHAGLAPR
jgi:glutathione S-transferase